jgi:hypothetical protein
MKSSPLNNNYIKYVISLSLPRLYIFTLRVRGGHDTVVSLFTPTYVVSDYHY